MSTTTAPAKTGKKETKASLQVEILELKRQASVSLEQWTSEVERLRHLLQHKTDFVQQLACEKHELERKLQAAEKQVKESKKDQERLQTEVERLTTCAGAAEIAYTNALKIVAGSGRSGQFGPISFLPESADLEGALGPIFDGLRRRLESATAARVAAESKGR